LSEAILFHLSPKAVEHSRIEKTSFAPSAMIPVKTMRDRKRRTRRLLGTLGSVMMRERALTEAFATCLRRVTGDTDEKAIVVNEGDDRTIPKETFIAVVLGNRSRSAVRRIRRRTGLSLRFSNWDGNARQTSRALPVAIFDRLDPFSVPAVPSSFDVLALVTTFNEADIIEQLITRLRGDQIRVHVVDNWSTDGTAEFLEQCATKGSITLERYPSEGPTEYFELEPLLQRVEDIANTSGADWIIHHDADEIREAPWPGVSLRDALWAVQQWGYNCLDHTIADFRPIDDSWRAGTDLASSFPWFEFGDSPAHFTQLKAWKPQTDGVKMASSGGHDAQFDGRRVFPYKFVTRHYPIRSQAHGERKILRERQMRWSPTERGKGWHRHYDHYDKDSSFTWNTEDLARWDTADRRFLLERLSGVGLPGNPWPKESTMPGIPERPFDESAYQASIEIRDRGSTQDRDLSPFSPGEIRSLMVSVRNDGNEIWLRKGQNNIGLASKWFVGSRRDVNAIALQEGPRAHFSANVHPGEERDEQLSVQAPQQAGTYTLLVDLVHEHARWFECGAAVVIEVAE
jgi:glycosyltransferase involved in cell wall biosynthesis